MQLGLRRESFGIGDLTWLASRRGVDTARTITLDVSAFRDASKVTTGNYIKSGEPIALVTVSGDLKGVPYNSSGSGGTNVLAGFLLTDITLDSRVKSAEEDSPAPLLDFGRIKRAKLPSTVPANATTTGQFVFV